MLKRLGGTVDPKGAATAIKDAEFPVPFASELEFNSPVHGTWNIVHTGMNWENDFLKSVLSDVLWIRSCERVV